jgi:cytoskeleton protein RodZ
MTGFGSSLKAERERCGLTLDSISAQTKVSVRHLQALETESFGSLPGGVFRRGIVRAYIAALGLDETPWMEKFQVSHDTYARRTGTVAGPEPEAWETFAENVKRNRIQTRRSFDLRWLWVLLMLIALAAAAWAVWHYILHDRVQF